MKDRFQWACLTIMVIAACGVMGILIWALADNYRKLEVSRIEHGYSYFGRGTYVKTGPMQIMPEK